MAELDQKQRAAEVICNAGIDACKKVCERKLIVAHDGQPPISFAERRKQLAADLEAFALKSEAELFLEPKSRELTFGTLGFRLSKPTIEEIPAPKGEKKSIWALTRDKIRSSLTRTLARLRLGAGKPDAELFSVSISPNKTVLLARFKNRTLHAKQLAKIGMRHVPERNEFFFEVQAKEMQGHGDAAPASGEADGSPALPAAGGSLSAAGSSAPPPPARD